MPHRFTRAAFAACLVLACDAAYAFHSGGVGYCEGCHKMHRNDGTTGNTYLLLGSDQSSTCLICHGSGTGEHDVFTDAAAPATPRSWTPGGDFGWIALGDRSWSSPTAGRNVATARGHNVVASDRGLVADSRLTAGPGGTYPANRLHCSSCHDPHGKYRLHEDGSFDAGADPTSSATAASLPISGSGSYGALPTAEAAVGAYRLLGGVAYRPKSVAGVAPPFERDPPIAVAPLAYNRSEATSDTRVAYGRGMSEWCRNCHPEAHDERYPVGLVHPAGAGAKLSPEVWANYDAYVATGDLSGDVATAYSSLVPFEDGSADVGLLAAKRASTEGAGPTDNVSCLSCHRAHATAFESMTRWNNRSELLTVQHRYADATLGADAGALGDASIAAGYTAAEYQAAMYDRPATRFATFQRSLCNKCHAKD